MVLEDSREFCDCTEDTRILVTRMSPYEEKIPPTTCTTSGLDSGMNDNYAKSATRKRSVSDESMKTENEELVKQKDNDDSTEAKVEYVPRIKWPDLAAQIFIHAGCLYGLYLVFTQAKLLTILWGKIQIFFEC